MRTESLKPARLVSPGSVLRRELEARGWSQKDLALIMGRPEQAISEIVQGTKRITPETALELSRAFDTSADLWLGLETKYRLRLAERERAGGEQRDEIGRRSRLYQLVPVRELMKRGWVTCGADVDSLERAVCAFLGIASLDDEPRLCASFRHSHSRCPEPGPQLAWVRRVEAVARGRKGPFSGAALARAIPQVLTFSRRPEDAPRALEVVAEAGVRVALVPHLPQSYVDGAAFWSDRQPVIGLSLRYDRIDAFWFNLMHELAHVASGDKAAHLDIADEDGRVDRSESAANAQAGEWLINGEQYREFVVRHRGRFSAAVVEAFAAEVGRHPGIVVGRLQHEGLVPFKNLRGQLASVRPHLREWIDA
jgi:HTH-type transcriptional regulator / antitoxin HigA